MDRAEFDKFADEYSKIHAANISISGEDPAYFADYKVKDVFEMVRRRAKVASVRRILDFGAGVGTSVPYFLQYFGDGVSINCVDVSHRSLQVGVQRFGSSCGFVEFDGERVPIRDGSFDIVFAACIFHHIHHAEHVRILGELRRVLQPGGLLFVFEHNPYNPLTVRAVNTCPFDENAKLISATAMRARFRGAGFEQPTIFYRIFFPRALRALRSLEKAMTWLPLGAQYYICARR